MLNKKYWLIFIAITVIAVFSRAAQVFNPYNYFFGPEQGIEYLVTKNIVVDHELVLTAHQGGFGSFSKGPGFNYLLTFPFVLTNGDPFGGRLMMFAISVLTVLTAFILTNRMFNPRTAMFISFLLAVSPTLKDYAGAISPPFVIPLLTVFFIYFLYKSFQKKFKYIPLLTLTAGIMMHFEMAAAGILLALLILTGLVSIIKKIIPYRYYLFAIVSFLITLFPLLIFDILNNFQNLRGIIEMFAAGAKNMSGGLFENIVNIVNNRFEVFSWSYISTFSPRLIIWIPSLVLIVFGILLMIKDEKIELNDKLFISYLLFIPIFTFLSLVVYPGIIHQWWIMNLTVIYCFLFGLVLSYFWKNKFLRLLVILGVFILYIAFINRTLFIYKTQFVYPPSAYIKEDQAIKYIFKNSKKRPFGIVILSTRPQENYDYLIWWNGKKYGYQPYRTPKKNYYAIIEPDLVCSKNKFPGTIIRSQKLSNDFIIEERLVN